MKMGNEKYKIWVTIEIQHEFYGNTKILLDIIPSSHTKRLLAENNIILKKVDINKWVLIKLCDDHFTLKKNEIIFCFHLHVTSDEFYYCSENIENMNNNSFFFVDADNMGTWKTLQIILKDEVEIIHKSIILPILSKHKYFEYLFIPKYISNDIHLKLIDDKNEIVFNEVAEKVMFENSSVYRFVSKDKISLRKSYKYKLRLLEMRKSGEKILSENILNPEAENISIFSPADTITSYNYI